jgi:hypothetical protein
LVIAGCSEGLFVLDISTPTVPRLVGVSTVVSYSAAVDGPYLYVINGGGLEILDMSDPSNLRRVGISPTPTNPYGNDVRVSGHFAYIATGYFAGVYQGLVQVLDVSDPTQPKPIGVIQVSGKPRRISIAGNYGYVTGDNTGLQTIDFSDPAAPKLTATNAFDGSPVGILATDDLILVLTSGARGEQTFDYLTFDRSDPAHPKPFGSYPLSGEPSGLASAGSLAYVADGDIEIIDFSDPAHLKRAGGFEFENGFTYDLAVSGSYAYLADGPAGLQVIDISDPRNPRRVSHYATPDSATGIVLINDVACLALGVAGVEIVDISDPLHPLHAGQFSGVASDITTFESYLCIHNDGGLQLLDISNPAQPKGVGRYPLSLHSGGFAFAAHDSTLFVGHDGVLDVIDWSDLANPAKLAQVNSDSAIGTFAVQGQYLYTVSPVDLSIWDVSQLAHPVKVGAWGGYVPLAGLGSTGLDSITLDGPYAFLGEHSYHAHQGVDMVLVDVSNPSRPLPVWRNAEPEFGRSIAQHGLLFSAQGELGLTVRSLPGPLTMVQPPQGEGVLFGEPTELTVGVYSTSPVQYQWYLGATGDTSHPVQNGTGPVLSLPPVWETSSYWVRVKNQSGQLDSQTVATRPTPPLDLKQFAGDPGLSTGVQAIALGEHLAYLIQTGTFRVLDVSNPARATELGRLKLGLTNTAGLTITEPNAYVWADGGTLQRIEVSDPAHPRLTGRYSTAGNLIDQVIAPSPSSKTSPPLAYLAADTEGLVALDLSDSTELKRLSTYAFSNPVVGIATTGNYVLALTGGTLQVTDFRDPAHPQVVGSYAPENVSPRLVESVLTSGHYALLKLGPEGGLSLFPALQILDISDPVHLQLIGSAWSSGSLIAVDGTRAFLTGYGYFDNHPVIQVVDFTDPASPALVGPFSIADVPSGLAVRGNNLFILDGGLLFAELSAQLRVLAPSLGAGTATLRWTGAPGVVLQQSHSLASPAWQDLEGTDGRSRIDLPRTVEPSFFRAVQR